MLRGKAEYRKMINFKKKERMRVKKVIFIIKKIDRYSIFRRDLDNFGDNKEQKVDDLFLTKKTVHSALPNISDVIRWSFDLRYQPIGQPTGRDIFLINGKNKNLLQSVDFILN